MSNPIFLNVEMCLSILLGELPLGLFATDRADSPDVTKRSYSSSEIRAVAVAYAALYSNLEDIYQSKFISLVNADEIGNWETDLFTTPTDASLPFATRKQNLLTKWRATGGLSYPYIEGLVSSILTPLGLSFTLSVYGGTPFGAWILESSPLDLDTYLAEEDPLMGKVVGLYNLDCNARLPTVGTTTNTSAIISAIPDGVTANIEVGAGITGVGIPTGTTVLSKSTNSLTMSLQATSSNTLGAIEI
jgi:hypothetical protein